MDEEKKTGLADAVETGASAAHTIKGAIKAGKAISGAAKGAAAGGPYGAVAGAVWAEWKQGDFPFYYCQIAPYDYGIITEKGKEVIHKIN